jgi:hypothetical protein
MTARKRPGLAKARRYVQRKLRAQNDPVWLKPDPTFSLQRSGGHDIASY